MLARRLRKVRSRWFLARHVNPRMLISPTLTATSGNSSGAEGAGVFYGKNKRADCIADSRRGILRGLEDDSALLPQLRVEGRSGRNRAPQFLYTQNCR